MQDFRSIGSSSYEKKQIQEYDERLKILIGVYECRENVFIYVENSVFFKYRRMIFNFKTHTKNLISCFSEF